MSKRKTVGERIVLKWLYWANGRPETCKLVGREIDRAIRRAQAKAWEDGFTVGNNYAFDLKVSDENPYRGRSKR